MTHTYGPTLPISQEVDSQKYRLPGETFEQSIQRLAGIEPVFTHEYTRDINLNGGKQTTIVKDYAYATWGIKGKTALELTPEEHIAVLTSAQKYCDSSVSKTVNIGDEVTYEQFKNVYLSAYRAGAKGCTTFRAAGRRMGILRSDMPKAGQKTPDSALLLDEGKGEANKEITENGTQACTFDLETGRRTCE